MKLWNNFFDIRHTKPDYTTPISYQDLHAWAIMSGNLVTSRECAIIMGMDIAFRSAAQLVAKQDEELMKRYNKGANNG